MTTTILIIVNVFSALAIIVLALMQQSKGDMGSAFGGGGSQSMFGSRGSANFLSRTTSLMCVVFFASSLTLAYLYAQRAENDSVISGGSSVLDQSSEIPAIDGSELPTIDNELPVIEDSADAIEEQVPTIESSADEVPAIPSEGTQEPVITE